jgi:hypothetical protein
MSCRVRIFSVGFVPEGLILEISAQFMAFPRACDALIASCFLVNDYLAPVAANIQTVAGEGDERIQACDIGRNFDDVSQKEIHHALRHCLVESEQRRCLLFFCGLGARARTGYFLCHFVPNTLPQSKWMLLFMLPVFSDMPQGECSAPLVLLVP